MTQERSTSPALRAGDGTSVSLGSLVGVGTGPGDPDLVTVRAADRLAGADVVFVLVTGSDTGTAERVALRYAEAWRVERLVFPHHGRPDDAAAWDLLAARIGEWFLAHPGGRAVLATLGDPGFQSHYAQLARAVCRTVGPVEIGFEPGLCAMQDVPSVTGRPLAEHGAALAVVPAGADTARLAAALAAFDTVVVTKVGRWWPQTRAAIEGSGRLAEAVVRLGPLPGDARAAADVADGGCPYLATVVVAAPPSAPPSAPLSASEGSSRW